MDTVKVGIIGMGHISNIYCENLITVYENTEVVACADVIPEVAQVKADKWGIPEVLTTDALLQRDDIQIVVNLTPPQQHYDVIKKALLAGKHVYTEKPLATTSAEAQELLSLAAERNLMLGSAPETNYGAGISTAKALIADGAIGRILSADAHFRWPGDENWHPNPAFLYQRGAGPLFDRGPYFLNALVDLLGKVDSVFCMGAKGFETRTISSAPNQGKVFPVEVPTHVQGLLRFEDNILASLLLSFDMKCPKDSAIEIFGTEGSILIHEPIGFGYPVELCKNSGTYESVPFVNERTNNIRGYAVSGMAQCLLTGGADYPAPGSRAAHVVEIMEACMTSMDTGAMCSVHSRP